MKYESLPQTIQEKIDSVAPAVAERDKISLDEARQAVIDSWRRDTHKPPNEGH